MAAIGMLAIGIMVSILNGLTISLMWGWFIVPTFKVPEIGITAAIGLSFLVALFVAKIPSNALENESQDFGYMMAYKVTLTIVSLIMGWIVHLFM